MRTHVHYSGTFRSTCVPQPLTHFRGWVQEVQRRAAAQRKDAADEPLAAIFGILERAGHLARGVGAEADLAVAESLIHLEHVCSQAVASVTTPKLYRFRTNCTYRIREGVVSNRSRNQVWVDKVALGLRKSANRFGPTCRHPSTR